MPQLSSSDKGGYCNTASLLPQEISHEQEFHFNKQLSAMNAYTQKHTQGEPLKIHVTVLNRLEIRVLKSKQILKESQGNTHRRERSLCGPEWKREETRPLEQTKPHKLCSKR